MALICKLVFLCTAYDETTFFFFEHFIAYITHWSVYINMQGDKETLSGFYKSPQVVINKVLSIYNQVWYGSILSIN